ncbi:MAG TPA: flagellar basal body P-ring formation chaperone FlgA [Pseudolabrys sp.]|nr:flagellar basal body P-ring formation chaperone FlgA [Pseudolabrys sp.]
MMRSIRAAAIALAAMSATAHAEATDSPRPTLKPEVVVNGDIVRIGDLIENAGVVSSIPIFRSPDLGYTGTVSADAVLNAVRDHALIGVDTAGIHDVVVTRASRTIPAKDIEDLIARTLSTRFDLGPPKDIAVHFSRELRSIHVDPAASGDPHITRMDFDARTGRFDATLEFPAAPGRRSAQRISGRASATVEIAILARSLERGALIKDADVMMERRPRSTVASDTIIRREDAVGLAARNNLQRGRPLHTSELMKPDLVQRNESVTLIYEVPGITLTVRGKATDGGSEGDLISVLNEQSKRVVQGVIVGPGRVAVRSGSARLAANDAASTATARGR